MTAWTVGLFGAGAAIARTFAVAWLEPVVLIALGVAFLFVSARMGARRTAPRAPARAPGGAPAQTPAPAPASVPVEQSA